METPALTAVGTGFSSRVVRSLSAFEAIAGDWDALLDSVPDCSVHLSHPWLYTWLQHFPHKTPFIVLVYDTQNRLVGAAPFKIAPPRAALFATPLKVLQFIGTDPSIADMLKILIHPNVDAETVLHEITTHILLAKGEWDVLDLQLSSDEAQLNTLLKLLTPHGLTGGLSTNTLTMPCVMPLPANLADYDNQYPDKRLKKNLKNSNNHLKEDFPGQEASLNFELDSAHVLGRLKQFFDDSAAYWRERNVRSEVMRYPSSIAFYQALFQRLIAQKNVFQPCFSVWGLPDMPMSYHVGFQHPSHYLAHLSHYETAQKKYRPGVQHMQALIRYSVSQNQSRFDFGRGDARYKEHWSPAKRPMWDLLLFHSMLSQTLWQWDMALKNLKRELTRKSTPDAEQFAQ